MNYNIYVKNNDFFIYGFDYPFNAIINVENVVKIVFELLKSNNNQVLVLGSKMPLKLNEISQIIKNKTISDSLVKEKKIGRQPFIINYELEKKYDRYILSTEKTLLKFLNKYLKNKYGINVCQEYIALSFFDNRHTVIQIF